MLLSDKLLLAAMIIIPLLITIVTGYALRSEKANKINIAIVDRDMSEYSIILIKRLEGKEDIDIQDVSEEEALKLYENNEVEEVFIIKEGFEEEIRDGENDKLIEVLKSPSSFSAEYVGEVVAGEVLRLVSGNLAARWIEEGYDRIGLETGKELEKEVLEYAESYWEPEPLMTVKYQEMEGSIAKDVKRVSIPASTAASTGIILVFIMFYVLFSSGWLVEERINGTLKRLVAGPNALGYSFVGSIFALFLLGIIQISIFFTICKLAFKVSIFNSPWSYVIIVIYLLTVISISLLLSAVLKTPSQLQAGAPVFALLTGFVGGCFWNFVEMPDNLRRLSLITPQGLALEGINKLFSSPYDISGIAMPILILLSISLILFPLSYIIVKKTW